MENTGTGEDDSDDEVHTVMCSVRGGEKSAPILCELEVQGEPLEFEIDTGSPYTIMGNGTVTRVCGCCVLHRSKVKIRSFTGRSVELLGTRDVNVKFRERLVEARLTVTEYQHNLLGRDLTDKLGVLTITIMYIYHALINALSAHMIHINLNIIFYTHVKHSHRQSCDRCRH